jgi:hypothetical protein
VRQHLWPLLLVTLLLTPGCQRESNDSLSDSYERMMTSSQRRAAVDTPVAVRVDTPAAPAPDTARLPAALPIETLPPAAAPAPADTPPAQEEAAPRSFEGTAGIQQRRRSGMSPATLRDVRTAAHEDFDRVVLEFEGGIPGYHIEYVDRPIRECGSGHAVPVAGQGWLRVRMEPARAHEFMGESARSSITNRNRSLDYFALQQLVLTCDFEAQVEWVLGVRSPNRYRVLELSQPARLVVDVLH